MKSNPVPPEKPKKGDQLLPMTRWSIVLGSQKGSAEALEILCKTYWPALLKWVEVRRWRIPGRTSEDLVQGLFEHLLKRDFLAGVAEHKGRFRTFILTTFEHYLCDLRDYTSAGQRDPGGPLESLDAIDDQGRPVHNPASKALSPDEELLIGWAQATLDAAFCRLREECAQSGHEALLAELEPVFHADEDALTYAEIGRKVDMSETNVKTAAHRIRKRFRGLIRAEVGETLADKSDIDAEIAVLRAVFRKLGPSV